MAAQAEAVRALKDTGNFIWMEHCRKMANLTSYYSLIEAFPGFFP